MLKRLAIAAIYRLSQHILPLSPGRKVKAHHMLMRMLHSERLRRHNAHGGARRALSLKPRKPMRAQCCALVPGRVSVVLPVYNQAKLLDESVSSVLAQTHPDLELIIINDGSDDNVEEVLQPYQADPRVRCYTQAHQGLPKALSNGFALARGEFWTWTSADNAMAPAMLQRLTAKLQAAPTLAMTYADYRVVDERGRVLQDPTWRRMNRPRPASGEVRLPRSAEALNVIQDNFIGPCFLYRGWVGRLLGEYAPQIGIEDYDYWMRMNALFPIHHLGSDELLYRYRVHDNTLSARAEDLRILKKVQDLMEYEKRRATYFQSRAVIAADEFGEKWLRAGGLSDAEIAPLERAADGGANDVTLLVVGSATAAARADTLAALKTPLGVIFAPDAERDIARLGPLLRRPGCVALVSARQAAARVRLTATCPVLDAAAAQARHGLVAFAKNHHCFHQTWSAPELRRLPPRPLRRPAWRRIVLQVDDFARGGLENVVLDLADSLRRAGFVVTFVVLRRPGAAARRAADMGFAVQTFAPDLDATDYAQWLQQHHIHLVNAHYSVFAARECNAAGIPFVATLHNTYVWLAPQTAEQYRAADPHTAAYLCVSHRVATYADMALGLDVGKMRVLPNGIDTARLDLENLPANRRALRREWQVTDSDPVFLNVASIMATKAQLPLTHAFAATLKRRPGAKLVLLGGVMEESYLSEIKQAIDQLGITDNVVLAGHQETVAPYYHAADVFVLPSYWEGWSLALAEAAVCGLACAATDVGAAEEFARFAAVEIIKPPFDDITELNWSNLRQFVYTEQPKFIAAIAGAMLAALPAERCGANMALARKLHRAQAYARHIEVFDELTPLAVKRSPL